MTTEPSIGTRTFSRRDWPGLSGSRWSDCSMPWKPSTSRGHAIREELVTPAIVVSRIRASPSRRPAILSGLLPVAVVDSNS